MTDPRARHQAFEKVWGNLPGFGTLAAVNHTSIGLRFMVTGMLFFLVGGLLAMLVRTQLALPEQEIIGPEAYNQFFTMHGTVMMFLFAIPVLEGLALYMIPKMIGARDLVFPRISSLGYYCYLFGGLIILSSLFLGIAPDSGWFMYTPLSSAEYAPGPGSDFWLLGITFVEISAMAAGIELTVSILRSRAPGMTLTRMPIFCWYILAMALMIIFGFPPLILGSILLELERAAGWPFFEVAGGGDPLLWQHLFWLFGHPEVYILFLPAAGIVSTLIPVFARRPLVGYRWIVLSILLIGFISFGLWVHHMFTVGIPQLAQAFFSVASMLVAVPTAIQVFAWLATLWTGRVAFSLPMLWIFGFLIIFVCGGLTGVMLALVPFNWQVHDTHFVVAHLHYVLVGGMFFPLMAGLYYWLPHISGRMPSERLGYWGFWLTFIGFNATFLLMHLTGLLGMPRRVYTYEAGLGWDWLNLLSSVGGFIMSAGIALILMDLLLHFRFGKPASRNPWNADTLEWATNTPPSAYNFGSIPDIDSRHPLWDDPGLPDSIAAGDHHIPEIDHGRRELLGTDAIGARVREVMHIPTNSWWPLCAALGLALVCISLLVRVYPLALFGLVIAGIFLFRWSWENGAHPKAAPLGVNERTDPPLHSRTTDGPGRWGMIVTLMADATLYLSLLFGWFYLWTVSPDWRLPEETRLSTSGLMATGVLLTLTVFRYRRLTERLRAGQDSGLWPASVQTSVLALLHLGSLIWVIASAGLEPGALAHDAVLSVMLYYLLFHSLVATLASLLQSARIKLGYVSAHLPYEAIVLKPFWIYTLAIFWISYTAFLLLPLAWGGSP
ncbi:cytochrome c oxidase subunit I [Marinimicrobium alkaliphilum]|uniref:cytochrome c oxidase subunit I n=1 Tax=Marinimicrobium alkaliphilum TaxID=2202654 RepID=UPI000DB8FA7C|nr:cytochrome c oxidase subunit I [Marinimicrobium alkaliphilum]